MLIDFGMEPARFRATYAEKAPLVIRRALPADTFSLDDLDNLLYCTDAKAPALTLHDGRQLVDEQRYTESYWEVGLQRRRIVKARFAELLRAGATLILNRAETRSLPIKQLCFDVARFVSFQTIANGYFCVCEQPSFGKHWDTHDVFAVQLVGRKRWRIYAPTYEAPVPGQTSRDHKADCPDEPTLDVVLEAGDVLYVPRGWWHCVTGFGTPTFHLAIGVHPPHVVDYVRWVCTQYLPDHVELRRALPVEGDGYELLEAAMERIRATLLDHAHLREYKEMLARSERIQSPIRALPDWPAGRIDGATLVRLNTTFPTTALAARYLNGSALQTSDIDEHVLALLAARGDAPVAHLANALGISAEELDRALRRLAMLDAIQLNNVSTTRQLDSDSH